MAANQPVTDRMQALIDTWEAAHDQRVVFLSCYAMMTRNMLAALEQGDFQDAVWVSTLLHRFADYYFDAVAAYDGQRTSCAQVWCFAFDAAHQPHTHVLQNLMLGVNAHISYDLVLALVDVLRSDWRTLSDDQRQLRYRDHCHVNDIIARTINRVQDQVIERYSPVMDVVDKLMGPLDEWIIAQLTADWREEVWTHAGQVMACSGDSELSQLRRQIEQHTMNRAQAIAGKRGIAGILDLV